MVGICLTICTCISKGGNYACTLDHVVPECYLHVLGRSMEALGAHLILIAAHVILLVRFNSFDTKVRN